MKSTWIHLVSWRKLLLRVKWERSLRICDTAVFAVFYSVSVKPFKCIWKETDRLSAICGSKLNLWTFGVDLCLYKRLKRLWFDDFSGYWWWWRSALLASLLPKRFHKPSFLPQYFIQYVRSQGKYLTCGSLCDNRSIRRSYTLAGTCTRGRTTWCDEEIPSTMRFFTTHHV